MARRTFLRNPQGVDVSDYGDYEESLNYFNFSQFNGINSNKNYVNIDQASFEKAENVYVDQDGQLHTRPPLKEYLILPSTYHVIQIFKINNLTIYHVQENSSYKLVWQYNSDLVETDDDWIYDTVKIINKNGLYIVFTQNSTTQQTDIKGFELYNNEWRYYDAKDIIYVPNTEIHSGDVVEDGENKNLLTNSNFVTYLFDSNAISTIELIGKTVTVTITDANGDVYTKELKFISNNEKVFTKVINPTPLHVDRIYVTKVGSILYYLGYSYDDDFCYFSAGGSIFYQINYPNNNCKSPILSDDGSQLYICDTSEFKLYVMSISIVDENFTFDYWQSYDYSSQINILVDKQSMNMALPVGDGTFDGMSSKYDNIELSSRIAPFGHSPEIGICVICINCTYHVTTYLNESPSYSETGTKYERNGPGFLLLVYNEKSDSLITPYLMARENSSGYWSENEGDVAYLAVTDSNGEPMGNKIKAIVGDDTYNFIYFNCPYMTYKTIQTDKNWNPYYAFGYLDSTNKSLNSTWQKFMNGNFYDLTSSIFRNSDGYYTGDIVAYYSVQKSEYVIRTANERYGFCTVRITDIVESPVRDNIYDFRYTFKTIIGTSEIDKRTSFNHTMLFDSTEESMQTAVSFIRISDSLNYLTANRFFYNSELINLIRPDVISSVRPVYTDGSIIVYYDTSTGYIYSNSDLTNINLTYKNEKDFELFMPDLVQDFMPIVLTKSNILYWTTDVLNTVDIDGEKHQIPALYIEQIDDTKGNWQNLPDDITELTVFSQTSLGVFLENNVYEFQYSVDNDVYLLTPTKFQLGNKKGSQVLANYDGQSIFITNIKGLISLTYEDFVQSTEQVYNYLTENIMSEYDKFADAAIKLYQYKDWLFMYKENQTELYVYDVRNKSWWYWTHPYGIKQIIFDGKQVIVLTEDYLLYYDFKTTDFHDLTDTVIPWKIVSQKIHFGAPNNYKHIRQLAVITTQNTDYMRYKLGFINYHNLFNLVDTDTVEYEINQLTTMIKRVTFMKTNAFQFIIKSDDTDKNPKYFATPNIAIKYRITERVR